MRPLLPILVACTVLIGCANPQGVSKILGGSRPGNLSASEYTSKEEEIDKIYSDLEDLKHFENESPWFREGDELRITDPEASKSADLNEDGRISVLEATYQIKRGVLYVTNKKVLEFASDDPQGESPFETMSKRRDYYASNPDNGLGPTGNQRKVAEADLVLIDLAYKSALNAKKDSDSPCRDLLKLREYYNNLEKPPFDGLGPTGHEARLRKVADLVFEIGKRREQMSVLEELRIFYEGHPNDGLKEEGHRLKIRQINEFMDALARPKN